MRDASDAWSPILLLFIFFFVHEIDIVHDVCRRRKKVIESNNKKERKTRTEILALTASSELADRESTTSHFQLTSFVNVFSFFSLSVVLLVRRCLLPTQRHRHRNTAKCELKRSFTSTTLIKKIPSVDIIIHIRSNAMAFASARYVFIEIFSVYRF